MQLNSNQIQEILPHRYPFLLIDKITECVPGEYAIGKKCVTVNEMHFLGHFPQKHIMPGVLIVEALAQTGAVVLLTQEEHKGKIVLFAGIKSCRFKRQVIPGDVLELNCNITFQESSVGKGKAVATVNGETAVVAELLFAIENNNE